MCGKLTTTMCLWLPQEIWACVNFISWLHQLQSLHRELLQHVSKADPVKGGWLLVRARPNWIRWGDTSTPMKLQWGLTGSTDYAYTTLWRYKVKEWDIVSCTMYKNFRVRRASEVLSYQDTLEVVNDLDLSRSRVACCGWPCLWS